MQRQLLTICICGYDVCGHLLYQAPLARQTENTIIHTCGFYNESILNCNTIFYHI